MSDTWSPTIGRCASYQANSIGLAEPAKATIPLVVLPVIAFVMVVVQLIMLLMTNGILIVHGVSPATTHSRPIPREPGSLARPAGGGGAHRDNDPAASFARSHLILLARLKP